MNRVYFQLDDLGQRRIALGAMSQSGFSSLLHKSIWQWMFFVERLEKGYQLNLDDYQTDLDTRWSIEELLQAATPALKQKVEAIVFPIDREFMRQTQPATGPVVFVPPLDGPQDYFWQARYPRVITGEMEEIRGATKFITPPDEGFGDDTEDALAKWQVRVD